MDNVAYLLGVVIQAILELVKNGNFNKLAELKNILPQPEVIKALDTLAMEDAVAKAKQQIDSLPE